MYVGLNQFDLEERCSIFPQLTAPIENSFLIKSTSSFKSNNDCFLK